MSRILFFLVALVALVFAILVFAPGIVPVAAYKDRVENAASTALGREVTIGGDLSFKIIPHTAFHVEDLQIGNAEGFDEPYLAKVAEADIGVKLFKLLADVVEIDRFVLTEPDMNLSRNRNGGVNWNLAGSGSAPAEGSSGSTPRELHLGDVRIVNGSARFNDQASGKTYTAEDIDLTVVLNSLSEPLEAKGSMVFQGSPATVDMVLTTLDAVMKKEPADLKLDLKIAEASAGANLKVASGETVQYTGPIRLDAPNLPALAALMGTELADAPGFDKLSLSGDIDGGASSFRLSNAQIGFDEIKAQGALNFDWSGARPKASGVLSTDKLDLRPYMPPPSEDASGFPAWSTAKMDFTSLRNIDADFDISSNAIFINDLTIGESRLKLTVVNGVMTADIPELSMYGGQGSGQLVVNARGPTPAFTGNFDMGSVQAQPFSKDMFRHDNLLGLGSFTFNFKANGDSQEAIMSSMDGSGGFDLADGALKGVNIAAIVRGVNELSQGFNPAALQSAVSQARGPAQQTDFSEFLSNFTITDGLVNAPTITLNGPYLTMTGKGTVNLPLQTIDIRLSPRGTTTSDGQGGRSIAVPLVVGGTFSKPTIGIDAETLIKSGAEQQLRGLIQGIGKKDQQQEEGAEGVEGEAAEQEETTPEQDAVKTLRGLFPGGSSDDEDETEGEEGDQEASAEETIANEAINAIFGRKKKPTEEPAEETSDDDQ